MVLKKTLQHNLSIEKVAQAINIMIFEEILKASTLAHSHHFRKKFYLNEPYQQSSACSCRMLHHKLNI